MNERPLTTSDLDVLAAIAAEDETVLHGRPSRLGREDVSSWLYRVELERDSWLFEEEGRAVAFGWFRLEGTLGDVAGVVAQGWKGRGLGSALVERGERRARELGAARLHAFASAEDAAAAALFAGRGYREARRFWEMAIELSEPPHVPSLPAGLSLEPFREADAHAFHAALNEAFRDHWEWHPLPYDEWWELRRGQDHDEHGPLWFVVRDGDELAGAVRNERSRNGGGYVAALGVRRPWRGRGLGTALLLRTFAEFHRRGERRVTLGVDADNPTGATHLYEGLGMTVESCMVVHEKELT